MRGGSAVVVLVAVAAGGTEGAAAQTREQGPWWPNPEWGAEDQAGASNRITPEKVLEAMSYVRTGMVYDLGHVYSQAMPILGRRTYTLTTPIMFGPAGHNRVVWFDEMVTGQLGQVGTQLDGLGHPGTLTTYADGTTHAVFYNGFTAEETQRPYGLRRLGIEHVRPMLTHGVLLDVAGAKGVEVLEGGYEITMDDVRAALARQGLDEEDVRSGDAVLFRSGWSRYWGEPARYNGSWPGIGLEVARWLVQRQVTLVGDDGVGVEVNPNPDATLADPVHVELTTKHGIFLLENLSLDALARDGAWEFAFLFTPLPLQGATGSPGRPLAVR